MQGWVHKHRNRGYALAVQSESMGFRAYKASRPNLHKVSWHRTHRYGYIHDKCMRAFRKPSRSSSSQDSIPYIHTSRNRCEYRCLICTWIVTQAHNVILSLSGGTLIITCISLTTEVKCEQGQRDTLCPSRAWIKLLSA